MDNYFLKSFYNDLQDLFCMFMVTLYVYRFRLSHCSFCRSQIMVIRQFKGCRMGRSDKVSLWYVSLLINTRFRFF